LVVTAGEACCRGEGRAAVTVKILDKPTITILPPSAPVVVCQDEQEGFVDVEFTVVSDTPDPISVPDLATLSGSGVLECRRSGSLGDGERKIAPHRLKSFQCVNAAASCKHQG
jgi:hypothetical protein